MKLQELKTFFFLCLMFILFYLSLNTESDVKSEMFKCLSIISGLLTYRELTQNQRQLD